MYVDMNSEFINIINAIIIFVIIFLARD